MDQRDEMIPSRAFHSSSSYLLSKQQEEKFTRSTAFSFYLLPYFSNDGRESLFSRKKKGETFSRIEVSFIVSSSRLSHE